MAKATVKTVDMHEEMEKDVIELASFAMNEFLKNEEMAEHIRKELDKRYSPTWHVVVGSNYGSHCTHETKHFIYFYIGPLAFIAFKSG
eukprot:CAMPEP_0115867344 /NCGR_PEP_ID=MMETSP0287-20121206/20721_1 /TAXON_ID=412157 /ORGANISM="Chrysochromulina rotalis, Strain UIO044" /LENGTH=87 /DNA_ID=CAMNT_0003321949 /DNA_START=67 /DNA_END=330 /DNA_ORIENTATION=+